MFGGLEDRVLGDLVEDHPLDRYTRLQGFQQMPCDGFALAVTIRGQIKLVDAFEQALQLGDGALLLGADDVERFKVGVDVDPKAGPWLRLELGGYVRCSPWQVPNVTPRGLDDVAGAQITGQFARLGGRLDYDQSPAAAISAVVTAPVSQLRLRSISYAGPLARPPRRKNDRSAPEIPGNSGTPPYLTPVGT